MRHEATRFGRKIWRGVYRRFALGHSRGPLFSHPNRVEGAEHATIDPTARIFVRAVSAEATGRIALGKGCYLGRHVELAAPEFGVLSIDEDTSIQDFCIIHGHVRIGAHCLFAMNIMVGSTIHRFRDHPTWLIRDQDRDVLHTVGSSSDNWSRPITIEDDCWLGWNVAVMPGVYVGRGAVIGANCVLTKDVGPYEIHGGVPNTLIGRRFEFRPPRSIDAYDDDALPYFYRGFDLRQNSLSLSRKHGLVEARSSACILLADSARGALQLSGVRTNDRRHFGLRIRINGLDHGIHSIDHDQFSLKVPIQNKPSDDCSTHVPRVLKDFTYVELDEVGVDEVAPAVVPQVGCYGISSASLLS
jgi:acetyltransferase-like isoleucine patch superfamily enzyme